MAEHLRYRFYQVYWSALDWIFPPKCGGCGKTGVRWCRYCQDSVHVLSAPLCPSCGQKLDIDEQCVRCKNHLPRYTALRSYAHFEGNLREAIHQLKYHHNTGLGEQLARPMVDLFKNLGWIVDLVSPVPLGLARLAERGYNQSSLLAKPFSLALDIPYCPRVLIRSRETRSQVGLTFAERRVNVNGAFKAQAKWATGKNVLVMDDVTTSGATFEACADALFEAGAAKVYGLTLARAVLKSPLTVDQPIQDS